MSDNIIKVENLGKKYFIKHLEKSYSTGLREVVTQKLRSVGKRILPQEYSGRRSQQNEQFWALKDVTFSVKQGEVLGVIGRNGAGKSTLLKILARITEPTKGRVHINGRIASLLEVGTGFHPELTGRENIFLNGAILGMSKAEIVRKFDEIVAFSEIEKFLDTPVKRYSSGMYVRLAFSVAAHLEPEILLVDEVLAVGDANFQKKCLGKMDEVSRGGRTVLFVSHNMAAVAALCKKVLLIDAGHLRKLGEIDETLSLYSELTSNLTSIELGQRTDRRGNGKLKFTGLRCLDPKGREVKSLRTGEDALIEVQFDNHLSIKNYSNVTLSLAFVTQHGQPIILCRNDYTGNEFGKLPPKGAAICSIPQLPLVSGTYDINLYAEHNGEVLDWVGTAAKIEVIEGDFFGTGKLPPRSYANTVLTKHSWYII